jgi:hypothetical protein
MTAQWRCYIATREKGWLLGATKDSAPHSHFSSPYLLTPGTQQIFCVRATAEKPYPAMTTKGKFRRAGFSPPRLTVAG